ncbi:GNAT family N-acetyltransferase [Pelagibius sp.]|uniref:GNAT family N-acetyltransferase n=1 Tax=Pelagibius sp. TaxID=1931238 RepID=UPI003B5091D4
MASDLTVAKTAVSIRQAAKGDAQIVCDLLDDLVRTLRNAPPCGSTVETIRHHGFGDKRQFEALIAEAEGTPAGLVLYFYTYSTWRGCLGVYVQDLHVVERFRGQGLGRRLLADAARRGRADGCTHLRLSVDPGNEAALTFYEAVGLEPRRDETICQAADEAFHQLAEDRR